MKNKIGIYVVSLLDSSRRINIINQFEKLNINFEFVDAVNGRLLPQAIVDSVNNKDVQSRYRRKIGLGEIGCALSHQKIYQAIAESSVDYAIIFEDDIQLSDNISAVIEYFKSTAVSLGDKNLYILGGQEGLSSQDLLVRSVKEQINVSNDVSFVKLNDSAKYIYRTCSYVVSRDLAKELKCTYDEAFYIADDWNYLSTLGVFKKLYLTNVAYHPEDLVGSVIEQERQAKQSSWKRSKLRALLRTCKSKFRQLKRFY
ncbi:glycosyltransferase family 25 protein [Vibrio mimicus]|uniref:Glycosyl transferase n=1 Tax=Vibrio mimicus TaxID=674 RepID=A0A2J9V093_VIBMI|nr:glycosyltransferase family 25 protein [Vibrio mimicus]KFE30338.1 glycosyltransferase 25 family protein [Vibrio mimicus]PNM57181.1 glycosyl transferase [Vibrio mimicus]BCN22340.1 putative glycosyltransferase [Vibrio mimicus]